MRQPLLPASLLLALLPGCATPDTETAAAIDRPLSLSLEPPRPLDELARAAAEELAAAPERLTLAGANGLEQLGVRWQEDGWVAAARERFAARLAGTAPLSEEEAEALRVRWKEVDLDPRWRVRLEALGGAAEPLAPDPFESLKELRAAIASSDPNRLLATWGRVHAWFGHVWIDPGRAAVGYDGIALARLENGWQAADLLGVTRDYTVRRKGDHASLRQMPAQGSDFIRDRLGSEDHGTAERH